jgi:hypothetical protein
VTWAACEPLNPSSIQKRGSSPGSRRTPWAQSASTPNRIRSRRQSEITPGRKNFRHDVSACAPYHPSASNDRGSGSYLGNSRKMVATMSPNVSLILPFENLIDCTPSTFENSSTPSSISKMARENPRLP